MRTVRRLALYLAVVFAALAAPSSRADEPKTCTRVLPGPDFALRVMGPELDVRDTKPVVLDRGSAPARLVVTTVGTGDLRPLRVMAVEADGRGGLRWRTLLDLPPGTSLPLFGDLDGDGHADVVAWQQPYPPRLLTWRGLGGGAFGAPLTSGVAGPVYGGPVIGDFDGDGRAEVVLKSLHFSAYTTDVYRYDATNGLALAAYMASSPVVTMSVGDFDGDGIDDIAGSIGSFPAEELLWGDPTVPLGRADYIYLAETLDTLFQFAADTNGDGRAELLARTGRYPKYGPLVAYVVDRTRGTLVEHWRRDLPPEFVSAPYVEDVDGDGLADLVYEARTNHDASHATQFLRNAGGTFVLAGRFATSRRYAGSFDVDGDGTRDAVGAAPFAPAAVLPGRGDLQFDERMVFTPFTNAGSRYYAGDLDSDGRTDLVVLRSSNNGYDVMLGRSWGGFVYEGTTDPTRGAIDAALADLDGDGHPDLVELDYGPTYQQGALSVAYGIGDGTFEAWRTANLDHVYGILELADLDGDGHSDVLVLDRPYGGTGGTVATLLYRDRLLVPDTTLAIPDRAATCAAGDVDGDGRADVVYAREAAAGVDPPRRLVWRPRLAGGGFGSERPLAPGTWPGRVARIELLDADHDGRLDAFVEVPGLPFGRTYRQLAGDGGAGGFRETWGGGPLRPGGTDRIEDVDGDGYPDLVEQAASFAVRRGDGTGGYRGPEGRWFATARASDVPGPLFGDLRAAGTADALAMTYLVNTAAIAWNPGTGRVADAENAPPTIEMVVVPVLDWSTETPFWPGQYRVDARAVDDCRTARATGRTLDWVVPGPASPVAYTAAADDEIRVYEEGVSGRQQVVLRGPDEARVRARYAAAAGDALFDLPVHAQLVLFEEQQYGPNARDNGEPGPVPALWRLSERVGFDAAGALTRLELHRPGATITFHAAGVDWAGKAATVTDTFRAAKARYCAQSGANDVACR